MTTTPVRSMTGFGDAELDTAAGRLRAELRTVNHRYLNFQIRSPNGFDRHHPRMEAVLRKYFRRGHLSLALSVERSPDEVGGTTVEVDLERAKGYHDGLVALAESLGMEARIELETFTGFRDLFKVTEVDRELPEVDPDDAEAVVAQAAERALEMREAEGLRMAEDLTRGLDRMESVLHRIEAQAPIRLVRERDRLREAIAQLLEGDAPVDEDRIAREIAHLAERWDIHEEIVRFRSHLTLFRDTLRKGSDDGVGKRFGFISQEILREANTLGSKANDAEIAREVVTLKEEIERLREQLENVE